MNFDREKILAGVPDLTDVKLFSSTDSTQREAKSDPVNNCLYLTGNQTKTYGRFGRNYFAADDGGIYMSLLLPAELTDGVQVTLLAAAALVTAIEELTDLKPAIKWVNDIYLANKKCVGILAESGAEGMILGIGINFSISEFPAELTEKARSLFPDGQASISPEILIISIWQHFYELMTADYFTIYKNHSFVLGKTISFIQQGQKFTGLASDLTADGALVVELSDGQKKFLNSGEISLSSWE